MVAAGAALVLVPCSLPWRERTGLWEAASATSRPSAGSGHPCSASSSACSAATTGSSSSTTAARRSSCEGYDGEPFLRFTANGVYENIRSPTTYLSRARDPAKARVPASADPTARAGWQKATAGSTFAWHDRRIRWTGAELPPAIKARAERDAN